MKLIQFLGAAVAALTLTSGCATYTAERAHPDFANRNVDIERVAVVPPIVEFNSMEFSGEEVPLPEKAEEMRQILVNYAVEELTNRGYTPVVVDRALMNEELEAYNVDLGKLREQYDAIRETLYDGKAVKIEDVATFEESVGEAAAIVASYSDADAVLLMRYYAYEKTEGAIAKDVAVAVLTTALLGSAAIQATSAESVEVAVLDGLSGNVLWTNLASLPSTEATALKNALSTLQHDIDVEDTVVAEPANDVQEVTEQGESASTRVADEDQVGS